MYAAKVTSAIVCAGALLLLGEPGRASENELSKLEKIAVDSGKEEIVIRLSGSKTPDFTSFTMKEPFRVVVDWAGSVIAGVPADRVVGEGLVRRISSKQFESESEHLSRVTIELARETDFRFETQGKQVVIRFRNVEVPPPAAEPAPAAPAVAEKTAAEPIPEGPLTEPVIPKEDLAAKAAALAKQQAEEKAKAAALAKAQAEEKARLEALARAEAKAKAEAEAKAKAEAIAKAKEEAAAKAKAEALARAEAKAAARAKAEADAKAKAEAIALAKAEAKARAEEEARKKAEAKALAKAEAEAKRAAELAAKEEAARKKEAAVELPEIPAQEVAVAEPKKEAAPPKGASAPDRIQLDVRTENSGDKKVMPDNVASAKLPDPSATKPAEETGAPKKLAGWKPPQPAAAPMAAPLARPAAATKPLVLAQAGANNGDSDVDPGPRKLTYVGFRQKAAVSEVFVRCDGKARYRVEKKGDRLVLELMETTVNVKNNERPLDTSFFKSAVTRVQAVPTGGSTRVEVDLRENVPYEVKRNGTTISIEFKDRAQT